LADPQQCNDAISRMWKYYTTTFIRDDGQINYYPGTIYPIDSHNYAATAIFYTMFGVRPSNGMSLHDCHPEESSTKDLDVQQRGEILRSAQDDKPIFSV